MVMDYLMKLIWNPAAEFLNFMQRYLGGLSTIVTKLEFFSDLSLFCVFAEMTTVIEKDFRIDSKTTLPPHEFLYENASNSHNYDACSAVIPSLPLTIKWLRDCVKKHPSTRIQVSNVDGTWFIYSVDGVILLTRCWISIFHFNRGHPSKCH